LKHRAQLIDSYLSTQTEISGKWYIAKPIEFQGLYVFKIRLSHAWQILTGKATAIRFKELTEEKNNG